MLTARCYWLVRQDKLTRHEWRRDQSRLHRQGEKNKKVEENQEEDRRLLGFNDRTG